MNISINSLKNFVFINSFLLLLGVFQHAFIRHFTQNKTTDVFFVFFIFIVRNYSLLHFSDIGTQHKPRISNDISSLPKEEYKYEFHYNVVTSTAVESITHVIIKSTTKLNIPGNLYVELLYFIPVSFFFEIIFDFFHYFGHRILHHKYLYKYLHKKHHKFKHPNSMTTFYQDPLDLVITNSIPTMLSFFIVPNISYFQFHLIITYKTFIEISGHIGKTMYPASCFSQFIWLPKILHIELYTEDHDLHHSMNNCNYSKRFSLWDKLFGTYKSIHNNE